MRNESMRQWLPLVLLPVLFYAGTKLSLAFAVMPEVLVMLWIPNSFLLAALLRNDARWYGPLAGLIIAAEIAADYPTFSIAEAALFGSINVLEVTIACVLLRQWRFNKHFDTPMDIAKFVFAGPVIAASASACAAAAVYSHFRGLQTSFLEFLRVWWFSDGLGLLILTPFLFTFRNSEPPVVEERRVVRWYDGIAALASFVVLIAFALSHERMFHGITVRPFLLIPIVLYAAARFSMRVTTAVVIAVAALILYVTRNGQQPFGDVSLRETVISTQELIAIMSTMALGIAALLSQHRRDVHELAMRVRERTAELSAANDKLQHLATTDPLTGILNRRALFELMHREMSREKRYGRALSMIMFDLDHFKEVNDLYGHEVGDAVLQHVVTVTTRLLRATDAIARYGGEEFVIVAPETSGENALQLAERLRAELGASEVVVQGRTLHVTASFGVATQQPSDELPEQILHRADEALYGAKAAGRDRVASAAAVSVTPQ